MLERSKNLRDNRLLRFLAQRSLTLGRFQPMEPDPTYLSGMSTLMMKLGPNLIGKGVGRLMDRKVSSGFVAMTVRMRLRDLCQVQTEELIPILKDNPERKLCFINIAGGCASDSINTLILLQKNEPYLLRNREIEINVLDKDTFGPSFGKRSVESLTAEEAPFHGLDISFRHITYDWKDNSKLVNLLLERKDCIQVCSSEGGLFEYGTDKEIIRNLNSLSDYATDNMIVTGDVVLDINKIDPAFPAALEGSTNRIRFIGIEGFEEILRKTRWNIDRIIQRNPTYVIFTLKCNCEKD